MALAGDGKRTRGVLEAVAQPAAAAELERRGLAPIELKEERSGANAGARAGGAAGRGIGSAALAELYGQLADLLGAGVPLLRALRVMARSRDERTAGVCAALAGSVEDGVALAAAMVELGGAFPETHAAVVRAGERGGFLEAALGRLSSLVRRQVELRQKLVGALIYPLVIATVGVTIVVLLFTVYVPQFRPVFEGLDLPATTRAVLAVSEAASSAWWLFVVTPVALVVAALWARRDRRVAHAALDAAGRLPVLGPLVRSVAVARVSRVLGALLENGVPLLPALRIAREAAGSRRLAEALAASAEAVRRGEPLAEPLAASGLLEPDAAEMIRVGEAANALDRVLARLADTLDARSDRLLAIALRLVEPALLLVLGVSIAVVAAALILPMMQLVSRV